MKILIADDERNVRLTLISMLQDLNLKYEKFFEAENGEKLINILREFKPDIAFVDIKMPKLDGLEAIKYARDISPNTKWVILTGFSEFDYAQKAIDVGVSKYLLKPVSPQILNETITALIKNKASFYNDLNKKFERDIIALYNNFEIAKEAVLEEIISTAKFELAVIFIDGKANYENFLKQKKVFYQELAKSISKILSPDIRIAFFNLSGFEAVTVCAYEEIGNPNCSSVINTYFRKISELSEMLSDKGFKVTVINSSTVQSFIDINNAIEQIRNIGPIRVVLGTGSRHFAGKVINMDNLKPYIEISSLILAICKYFNEKKYLYFNYTLPQLEKSLSKYSALLNKSMKNNISSFLQSSISINLHDSQNTASWIMDLKRHSNKLLSYLDQNSSGYIDQVISFVEENYMNDIGLNTIADNLGITPNYLGNLFQKKTNKKFLDFLSEIRLLKAKELLAETEFPIAKICGMVGYHSVRYFTKLFFESENQYPSDYRRNIKHQSLKK